MLNRWIAAFTLATGCLALGACQTQVFLPAEMQAVQTPIAAYHAYERSDCATVERLTDEDALEVWKRNEMRHSMKLLYGFCREISGDLSAAEAIYRQLVDEAPSSFAADDAAERIRIFKLTTNDPGYARWAASALDRVDPSMVNRKPIERVPVRFPPLAESAGIEGYAVVEFGVSDQGTTKNPVVVDSNPPLLFDGASVRAVRRWRFERQTQTGPTSRQLIRLLFRPDGQIACCEEPAASNPMSSPARAN